MTTTTTRAGDITLTIHTNTETHVTTCTLERGDERRDVHPEIIERVVSEHPEAEWPHELSEIMATPTTTDEAARP